MTIMRSRNSESKGKYYQTYWLMIIALATMFFLNSNTANAETNCKEIRDPRWPGLEECVVKADITTISAKAPVEQKRSLWCWAASLAMIFTAQGHRISQDSIVLQNFGDFRDAPGGDFLTFQTRLNRQYRDDNGVLFTSTATRIWTMEDAENALDNDIPLLYTTTNHATVQTELKYQQAPGGPMVIKGGKLWDPWPSKGWRTLSAGDVRNFIAAWSIETD